MRYAMEAAQKLAEDGIEAEVVDLRTLRPMDTATVIESVRKTNRCVTIEEGFPVCSIGSHISAVLLQEAFDWLDAPVINCAGKDVPMPYAANLEKLALTSTKEVHGGGPKQVTYRWSGAMGGRVKSSVAHGLGACRVRSSVLRPGARPSRVGRGWMRSDVINYVVVIMMADGFAPNLWQVPAAEGLVHARARPGPRNLCLAFDVMVPIEELP